MAETKIQWCDYTFNPWRGCTKVSPGCANCYAETMSRRNPGVLGEWGPNGERVIAAESYWKLPVVWNRAAEKAGGRRRVFCASLADVFEGRETMPHGSAYDIEAARLRLFRLVHATPRLDWLLLTKRPENFREAVASSLRRVDVYAEDSAADMITDWLAGKPPPNIWFGVSVEDQPRADERIPLLLKVPAAVRFLSVEPLLGPVEFSDVTRRADAVSQLGKKALDGIHWVIIGGESGPHARPCHLEWVRDLVRQCQNAGVACFVKQDSGMRPGLQGRIPDEIWQVKEFPCGNQRP